MLQEQQEANQQDEDLLEDEGIAHGNDDNQRLGEQAYQPDQEPLAENERAGLSD